MTYREPFDVRQERLDIRRWEAIEESLEFGQTFTDLTTNETHSYAAFAPTALEAQEQFALDLRGCDERDAVRKLLAARIEERVFPLCFDQWLRGYPDRLRLARQSGSFGYSLAAKKMIRLWDRKAGLSRLCPDDAREEAMRLRRRMLPTLEALQASGHELHYAVLTSRNVAAGELRAECDRIFKRFARMLKAKNADGSKLFPTIKGAVAVLEAPLGSARDWNVHLNCILVVKGYLDWKALRQHWHWNLDIQKISAAPGAIGAAFTELIKYAVAATVSKSARKAAEAELEGRAPPPPMVEWTGQELLEWLRAMRGLRRTRSYGVLFKVKAPPREELGQIVWLGHIWREGGRFRWRAPLLDSIPEDKFSGSTGSERWLGLIRSLAVDQVRGAGSLGESIPSHFELQL